MTDQLPLQGVPAIPVGTRVKIALDPTCSCYARRQGVPSYHRNVQGTVLPRAQDTPMGSDYPEHTILVHCDEQVAVNATTVLGHSHYATFSVSDLRLVIVEEDDPRDPRTIFGRRQRKLT